MEWKINKKRNSEIRVLRKKGFSQKEIAKQLGCGKSIVSYHCRGIEFDKTRVNNRISENARKGTVANKANWDRRKNKIREQARKEWPKMKKDPEFMGFLGLYWGEGTKRNNGKTPQVSVANTDPELIKKCKKFLDRYSPNYRCYIYYHKSQNKNQLEEFWSQELRLSTISMYEKEMKGKKNPSCKGICYLSFSNYELMHRILTWIECWKNE